MVPLLNWAFDPHAQPGRLVVNFLYSLVYSNCIGALLTAAVPAIWIRSDHAPFVVRWLIRIATVLVGTLVGCLLANVILMAIVGRSYDFHGEFVGSLKLSLVLSTAAVAITAAFDTYRYRLQASALALKQKELERERALSLATQMRLDSLQSRLQPHFLFNTINSISSLIHDDPKRAEDMLSRMAALLRFSLESPQPGLVPVERELSIVRDYLEIEKTRFGERLRYQIDSERASAGPNGVWVPPFSIQTLVENSIKYAVNARREGASIRVKLKPDDSGWVVEVHDDGPGFGTLALLPGHGLENLDERLSMLFGDQGRLCIRSNGQETSVSFMVPASAHKESHYEFGTRVPG